MHSYTCTLFLPWCFSP